MKWLAFVITLIITFLSHSDYNPSPYYMHQDDMKIKSISEMRKEMIQEWRETYGVPLSSEVER